MLMIITLEKFQQGRVTQSYVAAHTPCQENVDDEPNVLSALRRLFRRERFAVLAADNARSGLELLAEHDVQVVLSNQRMPHMSGTEFLSRVREL
jgi:response regulator RpfG family c-di-GMP phosphodiesterase